jgi:hypothetical protein
VSSRASSLQASNAFVSAGAATPDEFYDLYAMDLEAEGPWSRPLRVARDSSSPEVLWEDARVYAFGDVIGFGGYTALTASRGVLQPLWIDTRDRAGKKQEVFTARLH